MTIKAEIRTLFLRAKDTKGRQQTRRRQARGTARLPVTVLRGATCRTSTPDFLSPERQGDIFLLSDQKKRLTLGQKLRLETHILIFENPPCPEGASSLESHFPHSRATRLRLTSWSAEQMGSTGHDFRVALPSAPRAVACGLGGRKAFGRLPGSRPL